MSEVLPTPVESSSSIGDSDLEGSKDKVSYETHQRLLGEKKKLQAERDQLKAEKDAAVRTELERQGDFQKLLELEKKQAEEARSKLQEYEGRFVEAKKVSALLKVLDGLVDEKYFHLLPTDKILMEPESGEINMSSVAEAASVFKTSYPELIRRQNGPRLPNDAPNAGVSVISEADWKKLTPKEMQKWKPDKILWGK